MLSLIVIRRVGAASLSEHGFEALSDMLRI